MPYVYVLVCYSVVVIGFIGIYLGGFVLVKMSFIIGVGVAALVVKTLSPFVFFAVSFIGLGYAASRFYDDVIAR